MPLVIGSTRKTYAIETFAEKVLDVYGRSVEDHARVVQWDRNDGPNQRWYLLECGADVFWIVAKHSGRVLDLSGPSGNWAPIQQMPVGEGTNQKWRIEDAGDGAVHIVSAWKEAPDAPDLLLDIEGNSRENGAPLIVWHRNGQDNQRFRLRAA